MTKPDVNARVSALLVMDCQVTIMNSLVPSEKRQVLGNLIKAIEAARRADMPIIYVVVQFRENYPEVSPKNVLFSGIKGTGRFFWRRTPIAEFVTSCAPNPEMSS